MEQRLKIQEIQPQAFKAMYGLEAYLQTTSIPQTLKELIKVRASQINGCAFCIDMHTKEARKAGETEQRIYLLNAWRETNLFTEEEKAVLTLTEEMTLIHQHGVSDAAYGNVLNFFGAELLAQIIFAIATINTWNRLAISTQMQPGR